MCKILCVNFRIKSQQVAPVTKMLLFSKNSTILSNSIGDPQAMKLRRKRERESSTYPVGSSQEEFLLLVSNFCNKKFFFFFKFYI